MKKVPVLLLTGYLGSGKTTLLNRILNNFSTFLVNDIQLITFLQCAKITTIIDFLKSINGIIHIGCKKTIY